MNTDLVVFRAHNRPELTAENEQVFMQQVAKDRDTLALLRALPEAASDLERRKHEALSFVYSVPVQGVLEYQLTLVRKHSFALGALLNPDKYVGVMFNGARLPDTAAGVSAELNAFIEWFSAKSLQADAILEHYSALIGELAACTTLAEVKNIRW